MREILLSDHQTAILGTFFDGREKSLAVIAAKLGSGAPEREAIEIIEALCPSRTVDAEPEEDGAETQARLDAADPPPPPPAPAENDGQVPPPVEVAPGKPKAGKSKRKASSGKSSGSGARQGVRSSNDMR